MTGTKAHNILVREETTENLAMIITDYKSYNLSKVDAVKWCLDNEDSARVVQIDFVKNKHSFFPV